MQYAVLYSGSSGNCTYIKEKDNVLLIDAGVSAKRIKDALGAHGIALSQVQGILLTHEHADHVVGLKQLIDRHGLKLITNEETFNAIPVKYKPLKAEHVQYMAEPFKHPLFSFTITGLPISHDAAAGRFYIFENKESKLVYVTDTGYFPEKYYEQVRNANGYIIESNHEPELVLQSRYPWHIQQRILSDKGHLSNGDCATFLQQVIGERTQHVMLAHLSEENNLSDIAYNRIAHALMAMDRAEINIRVAAKVNTFDEPITI